MEPEENKKVSFAMEDASEKRWRKTKANTQIFFSASMMTSKRARARSSSVLRQSILDSTEKNVAAKISLHQACREGLVDVVARQLGSPDTVLNELDCSGYAPLHYAVRNQRIHIITMLLDHGADIDVTTSFEYRCLTSLQLSVRLNYLDVTSLLLDRGADLDKRSFFGQHALHYAARRASTELIKILLDPGVSPKVTDNEGCTALHVAAVCGRLDVVKLLLYYGADPCQMDCDRYTAIHYAAKEGSDDVLRELLKTASMAEVSFFEIPTTDRRDTNSSLHLAVENGHVECAKVCIEYGADPSAVQDNFDTPLHVACKKGDEDMVALLLFHGAAIDAEDKDGMTPMLRAALGGKVEIIDILLNEGANVVPPPDSTMPAPLLCAVKRGHHKAAMFLLQRGSPIVLRDSQHRSCLHIAVYTAGLQTVRVILENGGGILLDSRDKNDKVPLHYAAAKGDIQIVEELLRAGSPVDSRDEDEKLPLHYAAENGHLECVQVLLRNLPASINLRDSHLYTPLTFAAVGGHSRVVRYLINKGAELDTRDEDHVTPLIHAAKCGCYITVETLLDHGAKINAADKNNDTALVTAALNGKVSVVTMLLDRGADVNMVSLSDYNCLTAGALYGHRNVCLAIANHPRWEEACQFKSKHGDNPIKALIERFPDVAKVIMDKCITYSDHQTSHEDFQATYRFKYLDPDPHSSTFTRDKKFFAPKYMLQGAHKELLFHPLTLQLVRYKWQIFGLRFFYVAALIHLIFLVIFTMYIICTNNLYMVDLAKKKNVSTYSTMQMCSHPNIITTWEITICAISIFNLFIEGYQMYVERWSYIDTSNVVELATFSFSLVAVLIRILEIQVSTEKVFWTFTVVALLFTYLTMLIQVQSLFQSGIYVTMLFEVFKTMIKVVVFFVLVFLVYALVFHLLLSQEKNRFSLNLPYENITSDPFSTIESSFVKTMVMTIGEVEYTRFFVDEPLAHPDLARCVFVSFCLILPIVIMNLMIGLAVGDIDSIQKNAELKRLAVQIDSIYEFEEKLPCFLLRRFYRKSMVLKPNKKPKTVLERLRCKVNDQLFNAASDHRADSTFSLEEWTRLSDSLYVKMQRQDERVQSLISEVNCQKTLIDRLFNKATNQQPMIYNMEI